MMIGKSDLQVAIECLRYKGEIYDRLWQYYDGIQPLRYSTEKLASIFKSIDARFTLNWCSVVVDSVMDRLEIDQPIVIGDDDMVGTVGEWWRESGIALDADDVHLCTLVTGEAFVLVDRDESGVMQGYYNDSRRVHVIYDERNNRVMRFAAKWWDSHDGAKLLLYYPDRIECYQSGYGIQEMCHSNEKSLKSYGFTEWEQSTNNLFWVDVDGNLSYHVIKNPFGMIPIFHFRRETRAIKSELSPSILDTQDAINKIFADMMVAAEYGAFKQRWIISNADIGTLKNSPNAIWDVPAGDGIGQDTQIGEFSPTDLSNFMNQAKELSVAISKMSRTPQNYFFLGDRADPSGEALIAMEGSLNKKVSKYVKRFKLVWDQLMLFCWNDSRVKVQFSTPVTIQPYTQAQTRLTNTQAGIPLTTLLRDEGWTPAEIEQMNEDKQNEAINQQSNLALGLIDQARKFDRG